MSLQLSFTFIFPFQVYGLATVTGQMVCGKEGCGYEWGIIIKYNGVFLPGIKVDAFFIHSPVADDNGTPPFTKNQWSKIESSVFFVDQITERDKVRQNDVFVYFWPSSVKIQHSFRMRNLLDKLTQLFDVHFSMLKLIHGGKVEQGSETLKSSKTENTSGFEIHYQSQLVRMNLILVNSSSILCFAAHSQHFCFYEVFVRKMRDVSCGCFYCVGFSPNFIQPESTARVRLPIQTSARSRENRSTDDYEPLI